MPWNFLNDRSIFCSKEVIPGGLLGGFRMGGWSLARPRHDQKLGNFRLTPQSSREERGAREGVNHFSCLCDAASIKIP